jgi:uncharacterized membrane-anchored protein
VKPKIDRTMTCEAENEKTMANRSDWRLLKPANTRGPFEAVSLMSRRRADFHLGVGQNFVPCQQAGHMAATGSFNPVHGPRRILAPLGF